MPPTTRQSTAPKQPAPQPITCQHKSVLVKPSPHASEIGYHRPTREQRAKALGIDASTLKADPLTFPAPLVLPGDDLALNPKYPQQSLQSCIRHRNAVTPQRRTIYLVGTPSFDPEVKFVESWSTPSSRRISKKSTTPSQSPDIDGVAEYVRAFYHPLPVKVLPASTVKFVTWSVSDTERLKTKQTQVNQNLSTALIGLQIPNEIVGIRTRATPKYAYPRQLNLNDVLDAAIAMLPADAYALSMLVDQDMYEDDDDEFVCGRAYGGSRVSVVSTARYNPALDELIGLDLEHVWPMSHCESFIDRFVSQKGNKKRKLTSTTTGNVDRTDPGDESLESTRRESTSSPLESAINATRRFRSSSATYETPSARWASRLLRTAVHELAHCVGLDHCVNYACVMQGSASILEDHRQPPYLCPVDLAKILTATGATEEEHLGALIEFCERCINGQGRSSLSELVVAVEAWLRVRLEDVVPSKSSMAELAVV